MKRIIFRFIIYFIIMCIFFKISYTFMFYNHINDTTKIVVFCIAFMIYNDFTFTHGMKTQEDLFKRTYQDFFRKNNIDIFKK